MNTPTKYPGILLVLFMALMLLPATVCFGGIQTEVAVNKSVLLNLANPAERISIASPSIADIILITPRQIQINGLSAGSTSLIIWEKGNPTPSFFDVEVFKETRHAPPPPPSKQVLLQVKVAQVDKTSLKKLGLGFLIKGGTAEGFVSSLTSPDGSVTGNGSGTTSATTSTGASTTTSSSAGSVGAFNPLNPFQAGISYFPSGIGAVLQALATKGYAKILAEPNLLVKSGQKGKLHAGSKIPYSIVSSTGGTATTTIEFINVGVKLEFTPNILENGIIALKIDPAEVSSISGTLAVNGYPIIDARTVNTDVELKDGESLIMAGLLQEEQIKTMSKIPLIGDIPILGALFRSTQTDLREKELVFFITPKLIIPTPSGTLPELPTDRKLTPEEERELLWMPPL